MGLFDFLHKPSEKNLEGEIKKVQQMPKTLTVERDDGTITEGEHNRRRAGVAAPRV